MPLLEDLTKLPKQGKMLPNHLQTSPSEIVFKKNVEQKKKEARIEVNFLLPFCIVEATDKRRPPLDTARGDLNNGTTDSLIHAFSKQRL